MKYKPPKALPPLPKNYSGPGVTDPFLEQVLAATGAMMPLGILRNDFWMGNANPTATDANGSDEVPAIQVKLTRIRCLGATAVTQAQWLSLMPNNPSEFVGPLRPVDSVSWTDATKFCAALTEKMSAIVSPGHKPGDPSPLPEGCVFRLPTEAEWECACWAGESLAPPIPPNPSKPWQADPSLNAIAWYAENSKNTTHPVGQLVPNDWGFFDMIGNVFEWCHDWYDSAFFRSEPQPPAQVLDPQGPPASPQGMRALRGCSVMSPADECRPSKRTAYTPDGRSNTIGFRIAYGLPLVPSKSTVAGRAR